jgi:hypothetical protein
MNTSNLSEKQLSYWNSIQTQNKIIVIDSPIGTGVVSENMTLVDDLLFNKKPVNRHLLLLSSLNKMILEMELNNILKENKLNEMPTFLFLDDFSNASEENQKYIKDMLDNNKISNFDKPNDFYVFLFKRD